MSRIVAATSFATTSYLGVPLEYLRDDFPLAIDLEQRKKVMEARAHNVIFHVNADNCSRGCDSQDVRCDYGQSVAANTARLAVAPLYRDGGQAQFIRQEIPGSPTSLMPLIEWTRDNLNSSHTVDSLAARANMSSRTFARRFQEQTGTTPLQWLLTARIDRARELLEESETSIDQTAFLSGFGSAVTFRSRFRRVVGLTPTEYRRRFNSASHALADAACE